ncbi:hypothetical protein LZ554_005901 [Drepanopeziza brunnea f. sp. 'monogermtubi']|nr:hypothetical protein LZ554_005901 [Drepanopeziza brunnea f. sp. 'monogermtubi']
MKLGKDATSCPARDEEAIQLRETGRTSQHPAARPPGLHLHLNPLDPRLPRWRLVSLLISLCFGLFLSLLDTTIVATALYTISLSLSPTSLPLTNWVALAYTLSYLGFAVTFARVADIVGRRNAYMAAFIIFLAFSIGCGFAQTLTQLIAFRVLQGIGGSGLYSLTFVIMTEISPIRMQPLTGALAGAVVAMAGVLGPVLGGLITDLTTWRWVFWINAPIGIIPLIMFVIAYPPPSMLSPVRRRPWRDLDFFGATLVIAASVLVVFAFQQAGLHPHSWSSALFLAPLLVGLFLWLVLLGWEVLVSRKWEASFATMFPLRLLRRRVFMGHFLATLLAGFPYFVVIYSLPLHLQVVNGKNPLVSGLALLPMLASIAITSSLAGLLNSKRDYIWPTLLGGGLLMVIGCACLSTLDPVPEVQAKMYGFQVFVGLGFGLLVSTVSLGASLECELRDRTVAQGIIAQTRVLGGSLGIAASSVFLSLRESSLAPSDHATLHTAAASPAVRQAYTDAFSESMRVCAAISGACVLATLLTYRRRPMVIMERRREQVRSHIALEMEEKEEATAVETSRVSATTTN